MRKRSWARILRAKGIQTVVFVVILNFAYVMPAVMASGNLRNSIIVQGDWPQNDLMIISDSMTSSFSSFGHYLGPLCPQPSGWSDGRSNILWAGNIRIYARDNLEGNQDSPPPAINFRTNHPLHPVITCQNAKCTHFNKEEGKNIIRYGKSHAGRQKYLCHHCKRVFIETYETHLYGRRMKEAKLHEMYNLLIQGHSNRSIQRITGHHRGTINSLTKAISENPKNAERIIFFAINIKKADMEEMWMTINKNKKNVHPR